MIKTTAMIISELKDYASPADKLMRMVKKGQYIPIVKGLYATKISIPGYLLAGVIYGPSYLSFEFALSYHGLIPERVFSFTSATFDKKKKKSYKTRFGVFTYRDIPTVVYPYGLILKTEDKYSYIIASPEKALCDQLYKMKPVGNYAELETLLFEDLRIGEYEIKNLNIDDFKLLAAKYRNTNIKRLCGLIERL